MLDISAVLIYSNQFIHQPNFEIKNIISKVSNSTNWRDRLLAHQAFRIIATQVMKYKYDQQDLQIEEAIRELNNWEAKENNYDVQDFKNLLPAYFAYEEVKSGWECSLANDYLRNKRELYKKSPYSYEGMYYQSTMAKRRSLTVTENEHCKERSSEMALIKKRLDEIEG